MVGATIDGCSDQTFGQTEDYAIIIYEALMPPMPEFEGFPLYSCDGEVSFTDLSTNEPTSWEWDFGDTNTSDEQDPTHTYTSGGTYTVTLTVSNDDGSNSITYTSYVVVDFSLPCNIESLVPGSNSSSDECQGMLLDSGEFGDYDNNSEESFTIDLSSIAGENIVQLNFLEFGFSFPDILAVYDGADTGSPLIGTYTGTNLPNGGTINSTGNTITIAESTNGVNQNSGFVLSWDCINVGLEDIDVDGFSLFPNPTDGNVRIVSAGRNWKNPILKVYNISGKIVEEVQINQDGKLNSSIDLTHLSSGIYTIILTDESSFASQRLLIR